jgi:hypothetical protein
VTCEAKSFYDRIENDGEEKVWTDAILIQEPFGVLDQRSRYVRGVEFSDHSYLLKTKEGETEWGPELSKVKL